MKVLSCYVLQFDTSVGSFWRLVGFRERGREGNETELVTRSIRVTTMKKPYKMDEVRVIGATKVKQNLFARIDQCLLIRFLGLNHTKAWQFITQKSPPYVVHLINWFRLKSLFIFFRSLSLLLESIFVSTPVSVSEDWGSCYEKTTGRHRGRLCSDGTLVSVRPEPTRYRYRRIVEFQEEVLTDHS